jgi:hypothetical protein
MVRTVNLERLVRAKFGLEVVRYRSGFLPAASNGEFLSESDVMLGRVVDVDCGDARR